MNNYAMNNIANHFNLAASTYNDVANMQRFAGNALINRLKTNDVFNVILDLGCGTGIVSEQLVNTISFNHYFALDIAEEALIQARKKITQKDVSFILDDFDRLTMFHPKPALIFSNMALHWSRNIADLFCSLYHQLATGGKLAFTIPLVGSLNELRADCVKPFHEFHEIIAALENHGFSITDATQQRYLEVHTNIVDIFASLKKMGVTHFQRSKKAGLMSKKHLCSIYQGDHTYPTMTFDIGLFIASKP